MYSLVDIAPTIASILHISMPKRDGAAIPEVIKELDKCGKLILVIVDGFGLSIYERYKHYFDFRGMVFKCRGVSMHTTPAIATILTGLHSAPHQSNYNDITDLQAVGRWSRYPRTNQVI